MLCSLCNKTTLSLFKHLRLNVIKHPNSSTILGNYFSKHMFFTLSTACSRLAAVLHAYVYVYTAKLEV